MADEDGPHFGIKIDFLKAHRRCPVVREDWGRQACQIKGNAAQEAQVALVAEAEGNRKVFESTGRTPKARLKPRACDLSEEVLNQTIWLNKVGTFGVGSAGYWWGRAGACTVRLTHYVAGWIHALWFLLYSDDGWIVGRGKDYEVGLMLNLFVLMMIGAPLAWHKVGGGIEIDWIGYYLDIGRFMIGISESRANWARLWCGDRAREGAGTLGELRSAWAGCSSSRDPWNTCARSLALCTPGVVQAIDPSSRDCRLC